MAYVGYSGVANLANTSSGFASKTTANNIPTVVAYGEYVGDNGVVDRYILSSPATPYFILMENSGYVLQESGSKIQLEK